MALVLLIRHADNDAVGTRIAGRLPGFSLNAAGRAQAQALAERLAAVPIGRVYAGPLERVQQTAALIAERHGLAVHTLAAFDEVDFGEWQGRRFEDLAGDARWRAFNTFRSGTRIPGGELISEVQTRMVGAIERLLAERAPDVLAIVGHADPIRTVLCYYAGIPLDLMLRLEVGLASVSVLSAGEQGAQLLCVNHTGALPALA